MEDVLEKVNIERAGPHNPFVRRLCYILSLTLDEVKPLPMKTRQASDLIKELSRYSVLYNNVAKLDYNIDQNINNLEDQLKYLTGTFNKLHVFQEEVGSIMDELKEKENASRFISRIPTRITAVKEQANRRGTSRPKSSTANSRPKSSVANSRPKNNIKKVSGLKVVKEICKELGYDETLTEKEFLTQIFVRPKCKISSLLPDMKLHLKYYANLSKKINNFQSYVSELVLETSKINNALPYSNAIAANRYATENLSLNFKRPSTAKRNTRRPQSPFVDSKKNNKYMFLV